MTDLLDFEAGWLGTQVLWDVALWRVIGAFVLVFLGFLSRRLLTYLFNGILRRRVGTTAVLWDDDLLELVPSPLALFLQILIWYAAAGLLMLPTEPANLRLFVFQGLEVALAIAVIWVSFRLIDVLSRILDRASSRTETMLDDQAIPLLRKTLKVFLAVTIGVMIVQNLGYSVTSLIASLGIGGLALALAARDTVANFFGSIVIFTDHPFQIGDWVKVADVEGTVEEVGFRTTRIRQFDKGLVTVPNQTFTSKSIVNFSNRDKRRIKLTLGVTYETTAEQMRALLDGVRTLIQAHPGIDQTFHLVHFTGMGNSSLDILIYCFSKTADWGAYLQVQEELLLQIMELVAGMELEVAFPTQTVYIRDEHWPAASNESLPFGKGVILDSRQPLGQQQGRNM